MSKRRNPETGGFHQNEHGVWVLTETSGAHYGEVQPDGSFKTNVPLDVPMICVGDWDMIDAPGTECGFRPVTYVHQCRHFEQGEFGEMGGQLSPSACGEEHEFPLTKTRCPHKRNR